MSIDAEALVNLAALGTLVWNSELWMLGALAALSAAVLVYTSTASINQGLVVWALLGLADYRRCQDSSLGLCSRAALVRVLWLVVTVAFDCIGLGAALPERYGYGGTCTSHPTSSPLPFPIPTCPLQFTPSAHSHFPQSPPQFTSNHALGVFVRARTPPPRVCEPPCARTIPWFCGTFPT